MKHLKIEIPSGYEIDKEKSTFENIVFKPIKKELPKSWDELEGISGYYINDVSCVIHEIKNCNHTGKEINIFATKEQAEASLALAQLSQLREVYRDGWSPDWCDSTRKKYIIEFYNDKVRTDWFCSGGNFLSFQSEEVCNLFLENFRNLIEQAKPLMS